MNTSLNEWITETSDSLTKLTYSCVKIDSNYVHLQYDSWHLNLDYYWLTHSPEQENQHVSLHVKEAIDLNIWKKKNYSDTIQHANVSMCGKNEICYTWMFWKCIKLKKKSVRSTYNISHRLVWYTQKFKVILF